MKNTILVDKNTKIEKTLRASLVAGIHNFITDKFKKEADYQDFLNNISARFVFTPEQQDLYNECLSRQLQYIFKQGDDFETHVTDIYIKTIYKDYYIFNCNEKLKINDKVAKLYNTKYRITCVPDLLLFKSSLDYTDHNNEMIVFEIKYSTFDKKENADKKQNALYQLTIQKMLLEELYGRNNIKAVLMYIDPTNENISEVDYYSKDRGYKIKEYELTQDEYLQKKDEILNSIEKFWELLENGKIPFKSFDNVMITFKERDNLELNKTDTDDIELNNLTIELAKINMMSGILTTRSDIIKDKIKEILQKNQIIEGTDIPLATNGIQDVNQFTANIYNILKDNNIQIDYEEVSNYLTSTIITKIAKVKEVIYTPRLIIEEQKKLQAKIAELTHQITKLPECEGQIKTPSSNRISVVFKKDA